MSKPSDKPPSVLLLFLFFLLSKMRNTESSFDLPLENHYLISEIVLTPTNNPAVRFPLCL